MQFVSLAFDELASGLHLFDVGGLAIVIAARPNCLPGQVRDNNGVWGVQRDMIEIHGKWDAVAFQFRVLNRIHKIVSKGEQEWALLKNIGGA